MSLVALSFLPIFIPLTLFLGGWYIGQEKIQHVAQKASRLSFVLLIIYLATFPISYFFNEAWQSSVLIRHTILNQIMLGLVTIMGWMLISFSRHYMVGQANLNRYYRWLMFTLASVAITVTTNHLVIFWLGWLGISLSLNNLLTFYADRPRAILAAHKKFMLARVAELSLLVAFALLYQQYDSPYINTIINTAVAQSNAGLTLHWQEQVAACLIAFAALIKCAQLPFHGWLIQVVESPTPVSALLHAGVINLGGYLLLLFTPLVAQSALATWLLLIVAGLSTLASALIMTTRISIKVRLAWSTCAQMGLMLLEFALGLYELVLLHLLAHSFYKAYSFLNSGNAVNDAIRLRLSSAAKTNTQFPSTNKAVLPNAQTWLLALGLSTVIVTIIRVSFGFESAFSAWWLFALALTVLIVQWRTCEHSPSIIYTFAMGILLCVIYAALKFAMHYALPAYPTHTVQAFSLADIWAMLLFSLLFILSTLLHYQVRWTAIRRLSIALFAGLYLDEWLTRLVLKFWPVTLPARTKEQHQATTKNQQSLKP
ncbi:NADH-quinone oxidoreductase subunit L [Marinomonas rhizomae]|uniref:Probable inorganic carbon transporter subunit DabB n=1 Tax=Marinomonas rhizomae TaxID=491948 RepID=A0A366J803_9GAMM|nr:NADH-quinone oxidoreductase subunit L [Marinomonas rhizomae]RBP83166.1 NAD(P)H-quinone oxidoreductase subunit 5 [Marinomonas rhizomae]RNF72535.1 NADH-quinone oxidoreductase subunit L [Marinomonas rhizomae]